MTDIPAARNTLRVLKYIAAQSGSVRASSMSRELDIPRSSMYQLIRVMQDEGFLVHFPEERSYGLSALVNDIGSSSLQASKLERLARPLLVKLVKRTGLPVVGHVSVLRGPDVVYVVKEAAARAPTLVTDVGIHLPSHLTATGRSMLAHFTPKQVRALYPDRESLFHRSAAGPSTLKELDALLEETRDRGWAVENGEITKDHASVAVAVLDHNGYPAASVGLTFRVTAVDIHLWQQLGAAAAISAAALSMRLRGKV